MRGIKLHMNGDRDTLFDFREPVEGKKHYTQKMFVNLATEQGSDPLYPDRGTTLLAGAIGGVIVDTAAAAHLSNFAALDTVVFVNGGAYPDLRENQQEVDDSVADINITLKDVDVLQQRVSFDVSFIHGDITMSSISTKI